MKLLIVDDVPVNRKLLRVTLEAEGHATLEAADGVEALQVLGQEPVDGVISDILMPGMDGYRLCNEIRKNDDLRHLPIVIYTSTFISPDDEKMALNLGADKYLTKPASVETLIAALNQAVAMQHRKPLPRAVREVEVLKVYSDRLVAKLEEKNNELERQLQLSALAIDVGTALMHGKTLREILQRCAQALLLHLDAVSATIWTYPEGSDELEAEAGAGLEARLDVRYGRVPVGLIAKNRRPHFINFCPGHEELPERPFAAFAGYPLIVGERLFGVIAIYARNPVSESTLDRLASIADSVALGIERKRAEEELRQALMEQTTLLQEVHHRVKNNLQVICSLLSMQIACSDVDLSTGPLNDAHSRVIAMSLIHEQIYQSERLTDLDFGEYIQLLSARVFAAYCVDPSRIGLNLTVDTIRLTVDQAIPCGLILNELLSNALKHAFKDGRAGTIRITLQKTPDGSVELAVADDGVGFPRDFRWQESRSLGLKVVLTLVKQLRADLTVSGEGGGVFRFRWQLSAPEAGDYLMPAGAK
jgi:two-component sensor histidine kinase/CheY-like chemotaxis protein